MPEGIAFLRAVVAGRRGDELVFGVLVSGLLEDFKWAQLQLGFSEHLFVIHSLRHGAATFDSSSYSLVQIMELGRWKSMDTLKTYVRKHVAAQLALSIPSDVSDLVKLYTEGVTPLSLWLSL